MKIDLHCHSYFSDGKHSPDFLIKRAIANRVTHLAITDHDCITTLDNSISLEPGLCLISGVEISCDWQAREIHVVGLCIDPQHRELIELLERQRAARNARILQMDAKLKALGIDGLAEYCAALPCQSATRSHVADFLVVQGHCKNRQKAFKNFLTTRGRIYVQYDWCQMAAAIAVIHTAGGLAVLAHPGRYPLSKHRLENLVDDFAAAGGDGLEASYGNIDPVTKNKLCEMASSKHLYVSAGSDFHDSEAHWTDIGKFPALDQPGNKNAIWEHPGWHSR